MVFWLSLLPWLWLAALIWYTVRCVATDKTKLLSAVCVQLYRIAMDPPEYTCEDYGKQEG